MRRENKSIKECIDNFEENFPLSERLGCSIFCCVLLFIILPLFVCLFVCLGAIIYAFLGGFGYIHLCLWFTEACGLGWLYLIYGYPAAGFIMLGGWVLGIVFLVITIIVIIGISCLCITVPLYLVINILRLKEIKSREDGA